MTSGDWSRDEFEPDFAGYFKRESARSERLALPLSSSSGEPSERKDPAAAT
jgi:hypothetical protein